jgi:prepilin-type N-terminal cleavage/methylation domain-containing protein
MGATIVSQGSVVKRFAKNQSGFSLTEILVALGIFSIVLGGSATLMSRLQDSQKQMLVKSNLIESHRI